MTIGSGLIYTLDVDSPASHYIGYQVVAGIGMGLCIQVPAIVAQSISTRPDMAITIAIALCKQPDFLDHRSRPLTVSKSTSSSAAPSASPHHKAS